MPRAKARCADKCKDHEDDNENPEQIHNTSVEVMPVAKLLTGIKHLPGVARATRTRARDSCFQRLHFALLLFRLVLNRLTALLDAYPRTRDGVATYNGAK